MSGTAATIVDSDRIPFSDESVNGAPMRFTTAANLANYMQTEVELSADRVTSDTFAPARICSGTPSATDVCRGDGTWGVVPIGFDTATYENFEGYLAGGTNAMVCGSSNPNYEILPAKVAWESPSSISSVYALALVMVTSAQDQVSYTFTLFNESLNSSTVDGYLVSMNGDNRPLLFHQVVSPNSSMIVTGASSTLPSGPHGVTIVGGNSNAHMRLCLSSSIATVA